MQVFGAPDLREDDVSGQRTNREKGRHQNQATYRRTWVFLFLGNPLDFRHQLERNPRAYRATLDNDLVIGNPEVSERVVYVEAVLQDLLNADRGLLWLALDLVVYPEVHTLVLGVLDCQHVHL